MSGLKILPYFDGKLLDCIVLSRNDELKSMLKEVDLVNASDNWGTLLHYAAFYGDSKITRLLIEMRADIDCLNSESKTPLMIAVEESNAPVVEVLLRANASINIVDAEGKTAGQMMFAMERFDSTIFTAFVRRFGSECSNIDELAEKLVRSGASMQHAILLSDIRIMRGLLKRGVHINSTSPSAYFSRMTALHVAAGLNKLTLAKWLLDNNAAVDALNSDKFTPLGYAAIRKNEDMVRLLLEHGANPNITDANGVSLLSLIITSGTEVDDSEKCIEILLEHGAILQNVHDMSIADLVLSLDSPKVTKLLIAHLAMLDKRGMTINQTIMNIDLEQHLPKLQKYYKKCKQSLETNTYGELTLFDLLTTQSDDKMRVLARYGSFMSRIKRINPQLARNYPLYFKLLKKRMSKALDLVKLEDEAIPVLCQLLKHSYNQCYNFSRQIVGYLNESELQQLCQA